MAARFAGARAAALHHRRKEGGGSSVSLSRSSKKSTLSEQAASCGFTELERPINSTAKALQARIKGADAAVAAVAGPSAMGASDYPGFLGLFGFEAITELEWAPRHLARIEAGEQPYLEIAVSGHEEAENHTWYKVECALWRPSVEFGRAEWVVFRRLSHMRDGIHDILKSRCSAELYSQTFGTAPFAMRGGMPGTTTRLRGWFQAFTRGVNAGTLPPYVVACALRVLDGPFKDPAIVSLVRSCSMEVKSPEVRSAATDMVARPSSSQSSVTAHLEVSSSSLAKAPEASACRDAPGEEEPPNRDDTNCSNDEGAAESQ